MEILKKEVITIGEVQEIFEKAEQGEMDQIQRWTYDYVSKFTKTPGGRSKNLVKELIENCDLKEEEAVEITNSLPTSIEELRAYTFGWKKLILTDTLNKILEIMRKERDNNS